MTKNDAAAAAQPAVGAASAAGASASARDALHFADVAHRYAGSAGPIEVLRNVTFGIPAGAVCCVVGPSGCGKSTLLTLAAGLQRPSEGTVSWEGTRVELGPTRHLSMAFQQPGLFPWLTARENVAVGLRTRGATTADARRAADAMLDTVGVGDFKNAYPRELSGGMAQRVGIARALVLKPRLLLLDEPFAAVDAFTRLKLQTELKSLLRIDRPTVVFVTHDVSEAIALGDMIVVMTQRPASVARIIPVSREDRDRSSAAYAARLAETLACLGVPAGGEPA